MYAFLRLLQQRIGLAALVLLAVQLVMAKAAFAQGAQTTQVILSDAQLTDTNFGEAQLVLNFSDKAPTFTPAGDGSAHLDIRLANARDGGVNVSKLTGKTIRSVQIRSAGQDLMLVVDALGPIHVSDVPQPPNQYRRLVLSLKMMGRGTPVSASGEPGAAVPAGGLPHALEAPPGEDGFELIPLKYADVSEVVGLLSQGISVKSNDNFAPDRPGFGSSGLAGSGNNNYNPGAATDKANNEPLGQAIDDSLAIDRRLNAIWVRGSPAHIERVKQMIAMIDVPLDSVILETQFVELTETGQKALGIDFANANGQIGVVTFGSGGFIPLGVSQGCGRDSEGNKSSFCAGHVTGASFQAALYAQIAKGNGQIISTPRIASQSGSMAKIITGDALPILTSIALSGVNGVSQQVQYVNVGVTLQIAPRVSFDGNVSTHVFVVVSSVSGFSQGYPTISQREAETSATVGDGDSFMIGGLTQDEVLNTRTKVPLLGDIPLLGQAFRTDRRSKSKTELYIIITPHIVHHLGPAAPIRTAAGASFAPASTTVRVLPPPAVTPLH